MDCTDEVDKLYGYFGELSDRIHGGPWSFPSLKVTKQNMTAGCYNMVVCLAAKIKMEVTDKND